MHIHIIAIDTGHEAHTIRLAAEHWGADVSVTWVANSREIVDYFALEFVYAYLQNGNDVATAHQQASAHDDDRQQVQLYQSLPASQ